MLWMETEPLHDGDWIQAWWLVVKTERLTQSSQYVTAAKTHIEMGSIIVLVNCDVKLLAPDIKSPVCVCVCACFISGSNHH